MNYVVIPSESTVCVYLREEAAVFTTWLEKKQKKKPISKSSRLFLFKAHLAQIRCQIKITPSQNIPDMLLRNIPLFDNTFTLVQTWIVTNTFSSSCLHSFCQSSGVQLILYPASNNTHTVKLQTWYKVWSNAPDECTAENEK